MNCTKLVGFSILMLAGILSGNIACKKENREKPLPSTIERIALLLDYETGYGGYIYPVYNPYVFLKNGTVIKEPYIPISELPSEGITKEIAFSWGSWSQSGDKVDIIWHNGSTSEKEWPGADCIPAGKNEKLQGSFSSFAGGGSLAVGGSVGILSYSSMSFTADGWFTNKKVAGGGDSNNAVYTESNTAGKYSLDDYGITLTFNSGDVKKLFFCFYGEDKDVFRLAGRTYND